MILDFSAYEYYIRPGVTDSRKSWRTLAEMVDTQMGMNIRSKAMFLFCNKSRNCIKIVVWDNGYCVLMKTIPKGTFAWPRTEKEAMKVTMDDVRRLLSGEDIFRKLPVPSGIILY